MGASGSCPTDVPAGTTDKPQCILQDQSGDKYCALTCIFGGCPTGAKCAHVGGIMGICVYPSDKSVPDVTLHKIKSTMNPVQKVEAEFERWMSKWNKKYSLEELEHRFAIFMDNFAFV